MRNASAIFAIEAIDEALTEEEKELLAIPRGSTKITFKQILKARYGKMYSRYQDKDEIIVRAATIMDNNRHSFEKLKNREKYIEALSDPESFVTTTEAKGKSQKDAGVISTTDASSETIGAGHTKSREGSSQYGLEFPLDETWDRQDSALLEGVLKLKPSAGVRNKGTFNEEGKLELAQSEDKPLPPPTPPAPGNTQTPKIPPKPLIDLQNVEDVKTADEEIYLHSVALATGRSASVGKGMSTSISGRNIKSASEDEATKKIYAKGRLVEAVQRTQLINYRERIINQFKSLFTVYPCL